MAAPKKPATPKKIEGVVAEVQGVGETPVVSVKDAKPEAIKDVLSVQDYLLSIGISRVIPVDPRAGSVLIENISEGDMYVSIEHQVIGELLSPGQSRVVNGAAVIHLASTSRPTARITMYAK